MHHFLLAYGFNFCHFDPNFVFTEIKNNVIKVKIWSQQKLEDNTMLFQDAERPDD